MKFAIGLFFAFIFSYQAMAAPPVWTERGIVTKLQLGQVGDIYILTSATVVNPAVCNNTTYRIRKADFDSLGVYEEYYSLLLASRMSEKEIKLFISGSTCSDNYPVVIGAASD